MRRTFIALATLASALSASPAAASLRVPSLPHSGSFVRSVSNPWFPLTPGSVYVYRGQKDGKRGSDVLTVTHRHRTILGVQATVVADRLYLKGHLAERTTDWYAQDKVGNVWYLGERTATLDAHGKTISTDGSWQAGVHGARAGIYMPARPQPGDTGRQEYYKGHAEDQFKVLGRHARVRTPAVSSTDALLTQETTRLEPGTIDHKLYVRGVGDVVERTIKGGSETFVLFSLRR